jgi:hypothetical protein
MKILEKYGIAILLVMTLFSLANGCGANVKIAKLQKQVDSLNTKTISNQEMVNLIENTTAWETLRAEEAADSKKMTINEIKLMQKK